MRSQARVRVWGRAAVWCDPRTKADPVSYPIPTVEGLLGVLRHIYKKPEFTYEIPYFTINKPVQFVSSAQRPVGMLKRDMSNVMRSYEKDREDGMSTVTRLVDVDYTIGVNIVEAPFSGRTEDRIAEFCRRARQGRQYQHTYLGRAEYQAYWSLLEDHEPSPKPCEDSFEPGTMLFALVPPERFPTFWRPQVKKGIVEVDPDLYEQGDRRERIWAWLKNAPRRGVFHESV